jgi:radical SAM protein with 4Fe4S-binding SPASM domain
MLNLEKETQLISKRLDLQTIDQINHFARYVEIESFDGCNLNCVMCPLGKDIYEGGGAIPQKLFKKIVGELAPYADWIKLVCLSRNGEPLLNRNVASMVKQLKDIGIKRVNFSTNATALTEKRSYELIKSGLDEIRFSIDGFTKETFEKVRKGGKYEKILNNCLRFIKIRDEIGKGKPQVQIRFVEQKANTHELESWKNFWLSKVQLTDVVASKKMHSWGNELKSYEGRIDQNVAMPCISPFSTLEILYDGTVPLCGCDYKPTVVLGNVKNNSLKEIWNNEKFKQMRDLHSSGNRNKISICVGCKIWDIEKIKTVFSQK